MQVGAFAFLTRRRKPLCLAMRRVTPAVEYWLCMNINIFSRRPCMIYKSVQTVTLRHTRLLLAVCCALSGVYTFSFERQAVLRRGYYVNCITSATRIPKYFQLPAHTCRHGVKFCHPDKLKCANTPFERGGDAENFSECRPDTTKMTRYFI